MKTERIVKTFKIDLSKAIKADKPGEGSAVIAELNVIDLDGDVTLPGAFGTQHVNMLPAHQSQEPRLGKAVLTEADDMAIADFKFNLADDAITAREWYSSLKFDMENGESLQEWSYGFRIIESSFGEFQGKQVRFLKSLEVFEISPVLRGAGIGTGTLAIKTGKDQTLKEEMDKATQSLEDVRAVITRTQSLVDMRTEKGKKVSEARLDGFKTLCDSLEELLKGCETVFARIAAQEHPTQKLAAQYERFLFHHGHLIEV